MRLKVVLAATGLWLIGLMFATSVRADLVFALSAGTGGVDKIVRASNITGNPVDVILTDLWVNPEGGANFSPWGVAVNEATQTVYWTDTVSRGISQVSVFGGSHQVNFTHTPGAPQSISYFGGQIYFNAGTTTNGLVRGNPDGSNLTTLVSFNPANSWTTIDRNGEYLYFSESSATDRIARVNLTGTPNVETVVGLSNATPRGLTLNGDYVYWVDNGDDFLRRSLIGSGAVEDLLDLTTTTNGASATPNSLTTDGQFLYWTESLSNFRGIYRSNLDGSNALRLVAFDNAAGTPLGIAAFTAVPEPSSLVVMLGAVAVLSLKRRRREVRL
jgi:hypothetical protein